MWHWQKEITERIWICKLNFWILESENFFFSSSYILCLRPKRRLTRYTHGNHPRVQEPLVLSVTVEVHRLLKPTLISQSFDLPFAPFPTGIAYENAMQPASMSHANPFYLPFYKCKSQGFIQVRCYSEATLTSASFSACSADLIHWLKWRSICSYYIFSPSLWCG